MAPKEKYYVVWKGRKTGIFTSWEECRQQVEGYPGAQFKFFPSRALAEAAFHSPPLIKGNAKEPAESRPVPQWLLLPNPPLLPSICVDAACDGAPGILEYRGVWTENGEQIFHHGPFLEGTANIGEFLAIVHALDWLRRQNLELPVYTDSEIALQWIRRGRCATRLQRNPETEPLFNLIARAERFLQENPTLVTWVRKWDTQAWGENPADFGRK